MEQEQVKRQMEWRYHLWIYSFQGNDSRGIHPVCLLLLTSLFTLRGDLLGLLSLLLLLVIA